MFNTSKPKLKTLKSFPEFFLDKPKETMKAITVIFEVRSMITGSYEHILIMDEFFSSYQFVFEHADTLILNCYLKSGYLSHLLIFQRHIV